MTKSKVAASGAGHRRGRTGMSSSKAKTSAGSAGPSGSLPSELCPIEQRPPAKARRSPMRKTREVAPGSIRSFRQQLLHVCLRPNSPNLIITVGPLKKSGDKRGGSGWGKRKRQFLFVLMTSVLMGKGRGGANGRRRQKEDLDSCRVHEVQNLPGSHQFGSNFVEAMAGDPNPRAKDRNVVWGLTADLSSKVPAQERAMYISRSSNGGKTWTQIVRVDSQYFDADIGEGERNGLSVSPGGTEFVITTQRGAFQVIPQSGRQDAVVRSIVGPRVSQPDLTVTIPKKPGDPVTANVVKMTADGKHLMVGYGYFDLNPQI